MSAYLILGGTGFLGKKIASLLDREPLLIVGARRCFVREDGRIRRTRLESSLRRYRPSTVLNLAARWKCGEGELENSNFRFPIQIADWLDRERVSWIQFGTYFQAFYRQYGLHYDRYSFWKSRAWEELQKRKFDQLCQIELPHLVGKGASALFSGLISTAKTGKPLELSLGREYLPIARGSQVAHLLADDINRGRFFEKETFVAPEGQEQVLEWVRQFESITNKKLAVKLGTIPERPNQFLEPVPFQGSPIQVRKPFSLKKVVAEYD